MYELEYHDSRIEEYSINIIMGKSILLKVDGKGLAYKQMECIIDYRVDIDKEHKRCDIQVLEATRLNNFGVKTGPERQS